LYCGEDSIIIDPGADYVNKQILTLMPRYGLGVRVNVSDYSDTASTLFYPSITLDPSNFIGEGTFRNIPANDKWVMFTMPVVLSGGIEGDAISRFLPGLGMPDKRAWRIFKWQDQNWLEYLPRQVGNALVDTNFSMVPGSAYWLKTNFINPQMNLDSGSTAHFAGPAYRIPLDSGWNMFGIPYNYRIMFGDVLKSTLENNINSSDSDFMFFGYKGGFYPMSTSRPGDTLFPFTGYVVYSYNSHDTLWIPPIHCRTSLSGIFWKLKASASGFDNNSDWKINLSIKSSLGNSDLHNEIGIAAGSSAGFDRRYDALKPPSPNGTGITILGSGGVALCRDMRPELGFGQKWDLVIMRSSLDEKIKLAADEFGFAGDNVELVLIDLEDKKRYDLKKVPEIDIVFRKSEIVKEFALLAGNINYINNDLSRKTPASFILSQNYPNPFKPGTVINYAIPEFEEKRGLCLSLDVYDICGKHIKQLARGAAVSGYHSAVWSGGDGTGRPVASGFYLYKITVQDIDGRIYFISHKKMLLLK
jgi:hypothetical protein